MNQIGGNKAATLKVITLGHLATIPDGADIMAICADAQGSTQTSMPLNPYPGQLVIFANTYTGAALLQPQAAQGIAMQGLAPSTSGLSVPARTTYSFRFDGSEWLQVGISVAVPISAPPIQIVAVANGGTIPSGGDILAYNSSGGPVIFPTTPINGQLVVVWNTGGTVLTLTAASPEIYMQAAGATASSISVPAHTSYSFRRALGNGAWVQV